MKKEICLMALLIIFSYSGITRAASFQIDSFAFSLKSFGYLSFQENSNSKDFRVEDDDAVSFSPDTGVAKKNFNGSHWLYNSRGDEDIDALHILPNGNIVFSISNPGYLSFTENSNKKDFWVDDDDIVEFNPNTGTAKTLFNGSHWLYDSNGDEDIDAVQIRENGNIVFSIASPGYISKEENSNLKDFWIDDDDVVEFNPDTGETSTLFNGSHWLYDSSSDEDIDAVHFLPDGNMVFSTKSSGYISFAENTNAKDLWFDDDDLIKFNLLTGESSILFNGSHWLYDLSSDEDIDAAYIYTSTKKTIPEPSIFILLGTALLCIPLYRRIAAPYTCSYKTVAVPLYESHQ